jgi:guanylate cyclase
MENFGMEFITFMTQFGYERILRILGRSLKDFLNGLDNLHEYMRYSYPKLRPPSFYVEKETPNGLVLHYKSKRRGFTYFVLGIVKQVKNLK